MPDQLQDLLQRVYDEGVNKAKTEAESILTNAQTAAATIIDKAKSEAEALLKNAQKQADDLKKNTDSDLKMAAQNTMSAVKQKLTDVFLEQAFDVKLHQVASDPNFLKQIILEIIAGWKETGGTITIAQSLQDKMDSAFLNSVSAAAAQGMKVEFSPQMKSGFAISPADGSDKLSFTDEDFSGLFKSYLRPRSNQILFQP